MKLLSFHPKMVPLIIKFSLFEQPYGVSHWVDDCRQWYGEEKHPVIRYLTHVKYAGHNNALNHHVRNPRHNRMGIQHYDIHKNFGKPRFLCGAHASS